MFTKTKTERIMNWIEDNDSKFINGCVLVGTVVGTVVGYKLQQRMMVNAIRKANAKT